MEHVNLLTRNVEYQFNTNYLNNEFIKLTRKYVKNSTENFNNVFQNYLIIFKIIQIN